MEAPPLDGSAALGERISVRPNSPTTRRREAPLTGKQLFGSPRRLGFAAACVALAIDQADKYWMLHIFDIGSRAPIQLSPFLDLTLSWNRGVSYSLFAAHDDAARMLLLGAQCMIITGLIIWLWRARQRFFALALGLIIGGALGNAADRLHRGAVADFFYFHTSLPVGPLANYVFNLADVAITLGVMLLLIETFAAPASAPSAG